MTLFFMSPMLSISEITKKRNKNSQVAGNSLAFFLEF